MSLVGRVAREVEARAGGRCEYCRMHQALHGATFHVEHIRPTSRGGSSDRNNLAWCCPSCNLHKSDRVEADDPEAGASVPLFHPRRDSWPEHFRWEGYHLIGRTPAGRATALALDLNHPRRVLIRRAEELFGLFPRRGRGPRAEPCERAPRDSAARPAGTGRPAEPVGPTGRVVDSPVASAGAFRCQDAGASRWGACAMGRIGRVVVVLGALGVAAASGGCAGMAPRWGRVWTDPYSHRDGLGRGQMRGTTPGASLAL